MNLIISSFLYIISLSFSVVGIKISDYFFNYSPFWCIIFFINIYYPINILLFTLEFRKRKINKITYNEIKNMTITSIIFNIENILLFWAVDNLPLGIYIIGRSSYSFYNPIMAKLLLKKDINKFYYGGLVFLIISYVFLIIEYYKLITPEDFGSIVILLISGFTTSLYNNLIEKDLQKYPEELKIEKQLIYQLILSGLGFFIFVPISLYNIGYNKNFDNVNPWAYFVMNLVGISNQIYFLIKLDILGKKNLSGNQIIAGIDLFRRVFINVFAYLVLNEFINEHIILANVFMFIGSLIIICGIFFNNRKVLSENQNIQHIHIPIQDDEEELL
jgi:drug/metabolite transporter (DMT)-like permease